MAERAVIGERKNGRSVAGGMESFIGSRGEAIGADHGVWWLWRVDRNAVP